MTDTKRIRNFSIIAHIDHGKSTLADQFLLKTGAITPREFRNQVLDDMDLERERGITIQMHPVTVYHKHNGQTYELNLIDTPGHVDFNYEVSRSLAACEGVILLVDAFQGVQAQTVANAYLAIEGDLTIVPVLNKIDLPIARPDEVIAEMQSALGIEPADVLRASGKSGIGVDEVLQAIIERDPAAARRPRRPAQGAGLQQPFRHLQGRRRLRPRQGRRAEEGPAHSPDARQTPNTTSPKWASSGRRTTPCDELSAGQVGYFMAQIKNLSDVHIGDTVTDALNPTAAAAARLQGAQADGVQRAVSRRTTTISRTLREALGKLKLNDSSFTYQPEVSEGLGFGFRCGFLGMLHREIIQQRLERDSQLDLVQTAPNVTYEILTRKGETCHRQPAEGAGRRPDRGVPRAVRAHQFPAAVRATSAT